MANEFNVYHGQDGDIDYSTPVAQMDLTDTGVEIPDQALAPNTIHHYVRRQLSECALESVDSDVCVVRIDDEGDMIADAPNPPICMTVGRLAGAQLKVRWRYTELAQEIAPTGFYVYVDSGAGFDFDTPDATVAYDRGGDRRFSWTTGVLVDGRMYKFCVRSYRTGGGTSQNTSFVAAEARSSGPAAISYLAISAEAI
jgi:hypothetical protein